MHLLRYVIVHCPCHLSVIITPAHDLNVFLQDLNVLKAIKWEAIIVDESQSSDISSHFSHIKSLSADKRLLVFCGPLGVSSFNQSAICV